MDDQRNSPVLGIALVVVALVGLAAFPRAARSEPAASTLSCRDGLAVHLYTPQSPEATPLRTRSGLELRASERLLTITSSIVKEARIREYRERPGLKIGEPGPPVERPFFWVTLQLSETGVQQLNKVLGRPAGTALVVVCNEAVLQGQLARYDTIQGIDVLIGELPAQAAEAFARSFTSNVRWERRTPAPQ